MLGPIDLNAAALILVWFGVVLGLIHTLGPGGWWWDVIERRDYVYMDEEGEPQVGTEWVFFKDWHWW